MSRILIVDDDVAVTNYLLVFLMQTGRFESTVVNDSREVAGILARDRFDCLLLDMDMPNVSGIAILRSLREKGDDTPVVILTGVSDVDLAVKAMKLGAFDYLLKPVDDEHLLLIIDTALEHHALESSISVLPDDPARVDEEGAFSAFTTRDPTLIRAIASAEKMARSDLSIYIWGERGVGKEALARAIHQTSARSRGPFVAVDVAAHASERFPADLFGEARDWSGSLEERPGFVEEARGGTLFLDSVDQLAAPMQVRLKRVLQTGEFYRERSARILKADVRVIVASTEDLGQAEWERTFNRDLFYHLAVHSLHLPPLRERAGDIPLLAERFLREEARRVQSPVQGFTPEALDLLQRHSFPDNVQELRSLVVAALVQAEGPLVTPEVLPAIVREGTTTP
jgi:DNA-binding NtrC family response regulator